MKRYIKTIILLFVLTCSFIFSGCELLFSSASSDVKKYNRIIKGVNNEV